MQSAADPFANSINQSAGHNWQSLQVFKLAHLIDLSRNGLWKEKLRYSFI
jgi:hypothetical protein